MVTQHKQEAKGRSNIYLAVTIEYTYIGLHYDNTK